MPRQPRKRSPHDLYHIVYRGNNKQIIFDGKYDYLRYIENMIMAKEKLGFEIHAYCLMTNHVHLLAKVPYELMPKIAIHVNGPYAHFFNRKTGRTGHLFELRYGSVPINNHTQYKNAVRYIHQNPIFAGIIHQEIAHKYPWSSYGEVMNHTPSRKFYIKESNDPVYLADTELILNNFHDGNEIHAHQQNDARKSLKKFHSILSKEGAFEYDDKRLTDQEALEKIQSELGHNTNELMKLPNMEPKERNAIICELLDLRLPSAQIARLTGLGKNTISRAKN